MYNSESGIPLFRLTITQLAIFCDGPKSSTGNMVVAPEDNSNSAEHSLNTLKERLREGFANGWAEGWRLKNKPRVARKFVKKMLPLCFWLQGYLKDPKRSPDQYQPAQEDLFWCIELSTRRASTTD
jgi:hypothetical protein